MKREVTKEDEDESWKKRNSRKLYFVQIGTLRDTSPRTARVRRDVFTMSVEHQDKEHSLQLLD